LYGVASPHLPRLPPALLTLKDVAPAAVNDAIRAVARPHFRRFLNPADATKN
jgi:hypothetical protein